MTRAVIRVGLAALVICATAVSAMAQVESTVTQDRKAFEILGVDGNQLVVKLPEGTRELTVPEDFRFNVNGQMLSVRELKVGMKGTATITTRTKSTPVTVTEVKNGTIMKQAAGTIIVRTPEGIKSFTQGDVDKRGVKIMREGKPAQITDFREGDQISATIVTSKPPQVISEREVAAYIAATPPAATAGSSARAASAPAAAAKPASASAPAQASMAAENRQLPKTASSWPSLGFGSAVLLAMGLALTFKRRVLG